MRDNELLLTHLAAIVRHFGKLPTAQEIYFYGRRHPGFPSHSTFTTRFAGHRMMFERLRRWAAEKPEMADVARLCQDGLDAPSRPAEAGPVVYLLRAGEYFKIGWAKILEKRIRSIQSCVPEELELIHAIPAQDPLATEAQWHHRFRNKRTRGEWFKLTPEDIAEFRAGSGDDPHQPAPA
ncbi:MAG TPA: GIY-YIG nuclease family protein, partial [Micropepsaceae bacterium]|nr:GIY-YIG nuclease family protein [Micropepsaceae bacterium]